MNLVAVCAHSFPAVQIVTFEVMSNHLHLLACGHMDEITAYFELLGKKLRLYFIRRGEKVDLKRFECANLIAAETLDSCRNQIVYINRNNYVVDPDQTPFSYPFGANSYYFTPANKQHSEGTFGQLNKLDRRQLLHAREIDYPETWIMQSGFISPVNYVRLDIGEGMFRDARHYFHKVSRDVESYREIAAQLGETIYYTDDELISVVFRICRQSYDIATPALLPASAKIDIARTLHFDYNADNGKIARLLKLERAAIDALFPLRK